MRYWLDLTESERKEFLKKQEAGVLAYLCSLIAEGKKNVMQDFYEGRLKTQ